MTNCRILSQEICFRGSQYHKCSLLVNGWMKAHCMSNFTDGLCKTIWHLVKSLWVMLTVGQAWYCQLEEPDLIDLAVSLKARLELYIDAHGTFNIWQLQWMLSQEPWENPSCGGGVPLVTTWNYRCYCFAEKWSWKTRLNGSFPHLYPVAAWMNELM